ncbi:MAG TPA: RNA 2',3'-cyclic phosphodiesterase [Hellea balneolensis]|uniref:RNA 2',3'-cyclic phosphodiesterase n=1 Tax=Hellea balneolensis TaxID=287478 RepID=A0A7C3GMG2_9PROT|nr:RNA 2',3'-cyclic phosphodiesterase [Hellea balneolensis]
MLILFAALKPPDHVLDKICARQKGVDGMRWSPRENLHITLGYFGPVSDDYAEILDRELALNPGDGFELALAGADTFGGSRPHTLWLGVKQNPALLALHRHVRAAARRSKIEMEARKYTPHLTLAYVTPATDRVALAHKVQRLQSYTSKRFFVDEFALYSSNPQKAGANIYIKEANYPLLRAKS